MAILYTESTVAKAKNKPKIKTINVNIEEKPSRPAYAFRSANDRKKFITMVEILIRSSVEYKAYIHFLKEHMEMNKCVVLRNITNENGKRYSIEIHHFPFTLFDLVDTMITRFQDDNDGPLNPFIIADEVMRLHYDGKVGLIPLTKTMHDLTHSDKIFIPLQLIYQDYKAFYDEYEMLISENLQDKLDIIVNMSLDCAGNKVLANGIETEFTYVNIDEFDFPQIPDTWGEIYKANKQSSLEYIDFNKKQKEVREDEDPVEETDVEKK